MRHRNLSLVGRTVAVRVLPIVNGDVQPQHRIVKVEAVHPDGTEIGGTDEDGNTVAYPTGDIVRVFV